MNGKKNTSLFQTSFVTLGLVFRNAHTDQRTSNSANGSSNSQPRQTCHDRACGYERAKSWDRQQADACEYPERSTQHGSGASSGGRALWRFRGFFCGYRLRAQILWK